MKKILFAVPAALIAVFGLISCNPLTDNETAEANISSEQLTSELQITAESEGNNNLTVYTSPTRYIWVYDASTNALVGRGTVVDIQVLPDTTSEVTASYYAVAYGQDGTTVQSSAKSITVNNFTKLDSILTTVFGNGNGGYTSYRYTWNEAASDGVWGNGGYLESTGPTWWIVQASEIDAQAVGKNLPNDGLSGWFDMGLGAGGVKTSRGETGTVTISSSVMKSGWDIGTLTFSGTIPLMGIMVNYSNQRQYVYQILKCSDGELRLCAGEPGAGDWGTAWFWNFKRN